MIDTHKRGTETVPHAAEPHAPRVREIVSVGLSLLTAAALMLTLRSDAEGAPPYLGAAPHEGEMALVMTSEAVTPPVLAAALTQERCAPEVIAITTGGQWLIYVPDAPAFVNEGFPASLAQWTGFFVRCRVTAVPTSTPTPTPTPTTTPTPTSTPTATPTSTSTPTPTATPAS